MWILSDLLPVKLYVPSYYFPARNDASIWESKCQQLTELIGPFKSQLEQYGAERETLMEQKNTTQKELGRLQDDIAK